MHQSVPPVLWSKRHQTEFAGPQAARHPYAVRLPHLDAGRGDGVRSERYALMAGATS
jgi:hypothetical protein